MACQSFSLVVDNRTNYCVLALIIVLAFISPSTVQAAIPKFTVSAERAGNAGLSLEGVQLEYASPTGLELTISRINLPGNKRALGPLALDCPGELATVLDLLCAEGRVTLKPGMGLPEISGDLVGGARTAAGVQLNTMIHIGAVDFELNMYRDNGSYQGKIQLPRQSLIPLRDLLEAWGADSASSAEKGTTNGEVFAIAGWMRSGFIQGDYLIRMDANSSLAHQFNLDLSELSFDSPDGQYASEALAMHWVGSTLPAVESGFDLDLSIDGGELLLGDFYRNFSGGALRIRLKPQWGESGIKVESIHISDDTAIDINARVAEFDPADGAIPSLEVLNLSLKFPEAYGRYLESIAAIWTLDGLDLAGELGWKGTLDLSGEQVVRTGEMQLVDLQVRDASRGRFAVSGLNANIDSSYLDLMNTDVPRLGVIDQEDASGLSWEGLEFGPIRLGPAEVALQQKSGGVGIAEPLALEILGGVFTLQEFAFEQLPGQALDISLEADLEGLDMALLTEAFDWPVFQGEISGRIPSVSFTDGVVSVGGELDFAVFNGQMVVSDVRIERAFGVLPSLAANVDATGLDLELLTSTFEFGQIAGRMDGFVHGLRMLDWEPVSFDAWLGTPEDTAKAKKDISRQAVNHLTAIGGGGATAALTGPVMKLFNNFSYKRIGLGCVLQNNICEIRGLDDDEQSVLIMEGSGIPKIMIRAFNRNLDWPRLVEQLLAVSGGDSIRIGD